MENRINRVENKFLPYFFWNFNIFFISLQYNDLIMELKPLTHYYEKLKGILRDGDNYYIKKYTTDGFKKSYQMWNDYSHESIDKFFEDFMKDYPEEFLIDNCKKCHEHMSHIKFEDLFDILLRRLVLDAFIGFKAEDVLREALIKGGHKIHDYSVLSKKDEIELDTKYGIDMMTFENGEVKAFFQVKNTSTFSHDGNYIKEKRKEFFDKELEANDYVGGKNYKMLIFYVYDKNAFIKEGKFKFFVNPRVDKCGFFLDHLIRRDGSLKFYIGNLKSREIL